jgi:hypothetical protein
VPRKGDTEEQGGEQAVSEHMEIRGKVNYIHMPYGDKMGLTFCRRCKETCDSVTIGLHEGITGYWIKVTCGKCKKTMWTAGLADMAFIKDDRKCAACKKPTNYHDSCLVTMNGRNSRYYCSKGCSKKDEAGKHGI